MCSKGEVIALIYIENKFHLDVVTQLKRLDSCNITMMRRFN